MIAILTFLFLTSFTFGKVSYDGCKFEKTDTNGMTAEYDLQYFNLPKNIFRVIDEKNPYFEYVFNICGAIDPKVMIDNRTIPEVCAHPASNHGPCIMDHQVANSTIPVCNEENGYENTAGKTPSAMQIDSFDNTTKQCYWLGMEISSADKMPEYNIDLLNPNDAGKGVIFTILNGEWCPSVGRNRELRIKLECPDDNRIEFEPGVHQTQIQHETVTEIDTCIYELAVISPNACPNKCVSRMNLEMFAVCATHGICEADPYGNGEDKYPNGTLRCLCDDGYMGDICEQINTEIKIIDQTHPGLLAAIVICIILLGVAIVCAAVLCHKIRMKEIEETQSMDHLSGGMLADDQDAQLARTKVQAMSMDIGSEPVQQQQQQQQIIEKRQPTSTAAVQLHTVDDQLETDKVDDRNELLDDEQQEQEPQQQETGDDNAPDTGDTQD
eukprot:854695_1